MEDLLLLLADVKRRFPEVDNPSCFDLDIPCCDIDNPCVASEVEAVCSGAVLSTYQRLRVEGVCARLGLKSIAPLWQRDQAGLLDEMLARGVEAVLVKTASIGLDPRRHLGVSASR